MAIDYKLCPNCNNALDKTELKCPYCGNDIMFDNVWTKDNRIKQVESTVQNKKSSWCGCGWCLTFIIFLAIVVFMILVETKMKEMSDPHNSPFFQVNNSED